MDLMDMFMSSFLSQSGLGDAIGGVLTFIAFFGVLISVIQAFFGYKLMRFWIIVNGVMIGAVVGVMIGANIGVSISGDADGVAAGFTILGLIAGAIAGGVIAHKLWKVGVFILCFAPCFFVGYLTFGLIFQNTSAGAVCGIIVGGVGGYFAVTYVKPVVIIITSVVNGLSAGLSAALLNPVFGVVTALICLFGGFYFQCVTNGNVFGVGTHNFSLNGAFSEKNAAGERNAAAGFGKAAAGFKEAAAGLLPAKHTAPADSAMAAAFSDEARPMKTIPENPVLKHSLIPDGGTRIDPKNNSKLRTALTGTQIRTRNDREYYFKGAPVIIPQMQIADVDADGNIGLYLSIQNLAEGKRVIAVYLDIICYNVLKEKISELKDIPVLDLSIETGAINKLEKPLKLPDPSIRRCEIIPRHVVFSDSDIWHYEGEETFSMAPLQESLAIADPGLKAEFEKDIKEKSAFSAADYIWQPADYGDFWYCGCGQFNQEKQCVCCQIKKAAMFEAVDEEYLKTLYRKTQERLACLHALERAEAERQEAERNRLKAEQDRLKAEQDAERRRKLAELQNKTLSVLGAASEKGKETLSKAGDVSRQAADTLKKQAEEVSKKLESKKNVEKNVNTAVEETLFKCSECGGDCRKGDKFCMSCGKVLSECFKFCKECGFANALDAGYCMECGAKLEDETVDRTER